MKEYNPDEDYVKLLTEDELVVKDGRQFVYLKGLERLAKERGIRSKFIDVCATPSKEAPLSVIKVTYKFDDGRSYDGVADASDKNCKEKFRVYLTAMAESRAKARALRDAFGISLCSVEEVVDADDEIENPITDAQQHLIKMQMKEKEVTLEECATAIKLKKLSSLEDLTKEQASTLIGKLNTWKKKNG